jgi:tetratricopeptide (TPR) repeat protein
MFTWLRRAWRRLLLSALLLGFAWVAGRQALGNYLALAPRAYLADAQLPGAKPAAADLDTAIAQLRRAGAVDPSDPDVAAGLGQARLLLAAQAAGAQRLARVDAALADYRRATVLRPNSPYLWAALMSALYARSRLQPLDHAQAAELAQALRRAVRLGPWEPDVLLEVISVGPAVYAGLDARARVALQLAAQHALALQLQDG